MDEPVQITPHVYWVGTHDPTDAFQCNAYLLVADGQGLVIDPGSVLYFDSLVEKISRIIDLKDLAHIVALHQDPDVCGNLVQLVNLIRSRGGEPTLYTHQRTAVLVRHYGSDLKSVHVNSLPDWELKLKDGSALKFMHTPYLHAPGAIGAYYAPDRILFSGDIFGGVTPNWQLYAGDDYFSEIGNFHRDYMPAKEILLYTMTRFEQYDIGLIAPQHGSLIQGQRVKDLIKAFKNFDCGLYIDQEFRDELEAAHRRIEEQNQALNKDLALASHFQFSLIPAQRGTAWDRRADIAFKFLPSNQVSGDFLIIEKIDADHLGILVADVVGHGLMSGLATIQLKTLFDEYKTFSLRPSVVLQKISERSFNVWDHDIYYTAVYAVFNLAASMVTVACAGTVPPVHYRARAQEAVLLFPTGTPIGMYEPDEGIIPEYRLDTEKDDVFIFQTDGLIESFNLRGEQFDRLKTQQKFIDRIGRGERARHVLDAIMAKVHEHHGGSVDFDDDITIVIVKMQ
jgi:serine phosphatase RsbU (regulator of sigma subunit)